MSRVAWNTYMQKFAKEAASASLWIHRTSCLPTPLEYLDTDKAGRFVAGWYDAPWALKSPSIYKINLCLVWQVETKSSRGQGGEEGEGLPCSWTSLRVCTIRCIQLDASDDVLALPASGGQDEGAPGCVGGIQEPELRPRSLQLWIS